MYRPFIAQLLYEHIRMRRVLRVMEHQLDLAAGCGQPDLGLLRRTVEYQRGLPARMHHTREDRLFERLGAVDPRMSQELRILAEQHRELLQLEDALLEVVETAARTGQSGFPRLLYFGRNYLRIQKSHSRQEETRVFPLAMSVLTPAEWRLLEGPLLDEGHPALDADSQSQVLLLYRQLMESAKAA
jgi:hemerythrin-like domain-containing protein